MGLGVGMGSNVRVSFAEVVEAAQARASHVAAKVRSQKTTKTHLGRTMAATQLLAHTQPLVCVCARAHARVCGAEIALILTSAQTWYSTVWKQPSQRSTATKVLTHNSTLSSTQLCGLRQAIQWWECTPLPRTNQRTNFKLFSRYESGTHIVASKLVVYHYQ